MALSSLNLLPHWSSFWVLHVKWKVNSQRKLNLMGSMVWTVSIYSSDYCCYIVTSLALTQPYNFLVFILFSLWHSYRYIQNPTNRICVEYIACWTLKNKTSKHSGKHTRGFSLPFSVTTPNQPYQNSGQGKSLTLFCFL